MVASGVIGKIAEGLAYGEYALLLGAGASVGALGGNGRALPTGVGLRDALVEDFCVDTGGENLPLANLYDHLQSGSTAAEVSKYLREWFTDCKPSWQHILAEFSWKRIWTLNIDDVIETAFNAESRQVATLSWNERFSDSRSTSGQQIIHLHGIASRLAQGDKDALVFSLRQYAHEIANPRAWHKVFADEFGAQPFLIIGASLVEEIDLLEALDRGSAARATTGYPSVVVVPEITDIRKAQLNSYGFTVVESKGEEFVRTLLDAYRQSISNIGDACVPNTPGLRRFLQQFINLHNFEPHSLGSEDFYSGYHPSWNTILSEDDATLDKTAEASQRILSLATAEQMYQKIVLLTGGFGRGKSTGLLRIASNLRGAGVRPFLFRGDEYMDVDATIDRLKTVPRTVLLFDDFADHSSTLQRLALACKEQNVRMLLVCAERSARLPIIKDRIDHQFLDPDDVYWYGKLSNDDVDRIIDKLHSRGRLGSITRRKIEEQRRHFIELADRSLFDAMCEIEHGPGFLETISNVYQNLPTDGLRRLYIAACLCYDQSIPIPTGVGSAFAGVEPKRLPGLIEEFCSGVLVLTRAGIRPPHRITASLTVSTLPNNVRSDISLALAKALAPHIDQRAIRSGTREYRIARNLMSHENVVQHSGEHGGREWYEDLRHYYEWNGRYWDQRALLESRFGRDEPARSYAERSIQVHPHSFGYNTLGTVLLRTSIRHGSVSALRDGIANLDKAKNFRDWGSREHPFTTFFTSMIRFAQTWSIHDIPQRERDAWTMWLREARSSHVFSTHEEQKRLDSWHREWLDFAVSN